MMGWWRWAMGWIQSLEFVTQSAHMGWGCAVSMILAHWVPAPLAAALFITCWAAPKEMVLDRYNWGEGHGTPDYDDYFFYYAGITLTLVVHFREWFVYF